MKKTTLILTMVFFLGLNGLVQGAVKVYYLPDSGFLKVEGELTLEPSADQLSFLVFPQAQITEFWVDGLQTYNIERVTNGTLVTFSLNKPIQEATLNLSYEGFLPVQGDQIVLDRDTLWFPEFSFPIRASIVGTELPIEWELIGQDLKNNYPRLIIGSKREQVEQLETNLAIMHFNTGTQAEQVPTQAEFLSKIQMQVARLVNQINSRNQAGLEEIIGESLQRKGLPNYLVSIPESLGLITSEFISSPTYTEEAFQLVLSTEKGPKFLANMSWQEIEGKMQLQNFTLTPLGQPIPPVVEESLKEFVHDLYSIIEARDYESLQLLISPNAPTGQFIEFLSSLNTKERWKIKFIALEPLSITLLINHSNEARLLLNMGLSVGEENWLIDTLDVIPLR